MIFPFRNSEVSVKAEANLRPDAARFLEKLDDMVAFLLPRFEHEGKTYVTVAIGCTGGRHRSPTMANALVGRLRAKGVDARVVHRDIERG